jgi:hypothetical protein
MERKIVRHIASLNQASFNFLPGATTPPRESAEKHFFDFVDKNLLFTDNSVSSMRAVILATRKTRSSFSSLKEGGRKAATGFIARSYCHFGNK